uniref:VCBS repeat-containing protein n=1 Tax=Daphnia magna TaxID=35525 RepID=A0A0P4ZNF2_9CRUS
MSAKAGTEALISPIRRGSVVTVWPLITLPRPLTKSTATRKNSIVTALCLLFVSGLGSVINGQTVTTLPRLIGEISASVPAFADIHESSDSSLPYADRFTLYVSTFKPFQLKTDPVLFLRSPGRYLYDTTNWPIEILADSALWPNNPDLLPKSIVDGYEGIVQTSGFLVPGKTKGQLQLYNMNAAIPADTEINIASSDVKDYSYHRVIWKDMDGDGDLDAVTARFHNTVEEQNFLWLENPGQAVPGWTQHVIYNQGPDVHFRNILLNSSGLPFDCFIAGELWNKRATLYCIPLGASNGWNNPENIQMRIIDDTVGQTFDLLLEDFDNDGRIDFLLTSFDDSFGVKSGSVYIYEIPDDIFTGPWVRHIIADNFIPDGTNTMSPGTPQSFYPSADYANEILPDGRNHRKWILVSGDDDGKIYILRPKTEAANDFSPYEKTVLIDTNAQTAGKPAVGDLDGDGYTDFVAPGYSADKLYVFTYAPLL